MRHSTPVYFTWKPVTYLIGEDHLFNLRSFYIPNAAMKAIIACVLLALAVTSGKFFPFSLVSYFGVFRLFSIF